MSQQFRNCPVSCPIAASAQQPRTWASWALSATTTALILSAASALALTSTLAPNVDQPIFLTLPPAPAAADTMAAISDPAPIANAEAPTPPQLEADAPEPIAEPDPLPDLPKPQPVAKNLPKPIALPEQLADAKPQMDLPLPQPDPLPAPDALPATADPVPVAPEHAKPKVEQPTPEKAETKPKPKKTTKAKAKKPEEPARKKTAKARSAPAAGGAAAPAKAAKAAAQGQSPAAYQKAVMKKIRGTKKRASPGKGSAVVGFVIASNGGLSLVKIVKSSGTAALDAAAVDHIQRAAPFAPPPAGAKTKFSFEFVGK